MTKAQQPVWLRSRFCESSACLEVADIADSSIGIRDSLNPDSVLVVSKRDWAVFIAGARAGDFQLPEGR